MGRSHVVAASMLAALGLLLLAWVFGNAPFVAPDETQHYLRAVGIGQGHMIGPRVTYPQDGLSRVKYAWVEQAARGVSVPAGLDPTGVDCAAQHPEVSALCVASATSPGQTSLGVQVGNYQPLPYLLPGWALLRGRTPVRALYLARLAAAAQVLLLFAVGLFAFIAGRDRARVRLAGVAVALTPMAIFVASSLNPSGVEIAGGFALAACVLRLADRPTRATWIATAITSAVLAVSRSPGAVWVLLLAVLYVAWAGPRRVRATARDDPLPVAGVGIAALVGVIGNRVWEQRYGSHVTSFFPSPWRVVSQAWRLAPRMARETVGKFGYLNVKLPAVAYWGWWLLVLVVVGGALLVARGRRRLVIGAAAAFMLVLPALQHYYVGLGSGYGVQARHLLPVFVALPLLAAEGAARRDGELAARSEGVAVVVVLAAELLQIVAWWTNARRGAVGVFGPHLFFLHPAWSPPLGWWPWLFCCVASAACVVVACFATSTRWRQATS